MKLVEQHIITKNHPSYKKLDEACFKSKNLYNAALYTLKKEFQVSGKWIRYNELEKIFKTTNNSDYRNLTIGSSQQTLMLLDRNVKSYFSSIKEWKRNPKKFFGCPKFPKYLDKTKGRFILIYTYSQFGFKNGYITFPKKEGISPLKTKCKKEDIKQVRVIPKSGRYVIEVVYEVPDVSSKEEGETLAIDLGVNNLATITGRNLKSPIIINGRPLKAINQYYNKKLAKIKSSLEKNHRKKSSKRINTLTLKRNNKIKDYMHKASKKIVEIAEANNVSKIVVGKNDGWKQNVNIGKKNNQNFVSIPYDTMFIQMLKYKLQMKGSALIEINESYTSKCSSIDLEPICKHESYVGERIKRGLFKSKNGILINSDVNGSWNILRKESGDVNLLSSIGLGLNPIKINLY